VLSACAGPFLWAGYHWRAGRAALSRYHSAEARAHLEACLRVWPWSRSSDVHLLAARAARREEDFASAAEHLHASQDALHNTSPEVLLEWALLRAASGDVDTVEEYLRERGRADPASAPLILEALGEGYRRLSRIVNALRCSDDWLAREPDNVQAWAFRGKIHRQVGASQDAVTDFRRVTQLDPDYPQGRWSLAVVLSQTGRYEEAAGLLESIRRRGPDDADVRVRLAICRDNLGQRDEAVALLDDVLEKNPEHDLALRTRGVIALKAGELSEAESLLRRAVAASPYDYHARYALWDCLRRQDKTEQAEEERGPMEHLFDLQQRQTEILGHVMSQKPDDPAVQCELGTLYLQLGRPEVGEAWLLNALRLDANYSPALKALAGYYSQRGDAEKAEEYRQRSLQSSR
jgi:tetratricopeptide (TPR) repeat protein